MGLGSEFLRMAKHLGGLGNLARLFPAVRAAKSEAAVEAALPSDAAEVFEPRVERSLGPIFRRARMDLAPRLGTLSFAILHRGWEAQRLFLEAVAGELDQAAGDRRAKKT